MKIRLALAMLVLAALTRLGLNFLPEPPHNFSPITAIGLFSAAYLGRRWMAFAVPFAALFLSDLVINNVIYSAYFSGFAWITSVWTYFSFAIVIVAGLLFFRNKVNPAQVVAASITGSLLFFLVSNFTTFIGSGMYPQTPGGLLTCYAAGLPFLSNTVIGDLFFSAVLFGAFEWVTRKQPAFQS